MPLFAPTKLIRSETPRLPRCGRCGLRSGCRSPSMPPTGRGRLGVLVVAEAPGEREDEWNEQLVGPAGQTLRECLKEIDVDLDRDCWKTNAVICCPHGNPTREQAIACRPNLTRTIDELRPSTILLLGGHAVDSLIGRLWREEPGPVSRWVGWRIPSQRLNAWVCPTFHPSHVARSEREEGDGGRRVVGVLFREHLRRAFELKRRPWEKPPRFEEQVETLFDPAAVVVAIRCLIKAERPIAFDFETNMLKPDSPKAEIISCAASNGRRTIAYMMSGPAVEATREFLRSPVPKIAANLKFEDRWSEAILGVRPRNWMHCTMVGAHVLDNRPGISGLKFQTFVRLGQERWDEQAEEFKRSSGPHEPNRMRRMPIEDLLRYNGMDAVCTWHVARGQMEEMR